MADKIQITGGHFVCTEYDERIVRSGLRTEISYNNEICRLLLDSLCIVPSGIHTRCLSVTKWFFPLASIWSVPESIYIIWCLLCECGLSSISSLPVILVRISQSGIFSISESRFSFHELSGANCIVYVFLCKSGTNVNK